MYITTSDINYTILFKPYKLNTIQVEERLFYYSKLTTGIYLTSSKNAIREPRIQMHIKASEAT